MDWKTLTTKDRFYQDRMDGADNPDAEGFTLFQQDAQRILYSSAFRRLQGKTQVHPFPSYDYLRTRLTHSIEVANVARSIATRIADILQKDDDTVNPVDWGDIVYCASLIHDIGNPPFGHVGEYAIQSWFEDNKEKGAIGDVLGDERYAGDFLGFEGNAQGFRVVTRLAGWREQGGLRLTNSVLASFIKYPYGSTKRFSSRYKSPGKSKFGFTWDDRDAAAEVFKSVGIPHKEQEGYARHPFVHILEAADDICYRTTDIEDAFRIGHLQFKAAETLLRPLAEKGGDPKRYNEIPEAEEQDRIAYLRSGAIVGLSKIAVRRFIDMKDTIEADSLGQDLIKDPNVAGDLEAIAEACRDKVYKERRKLETESAGITILSYLLEHLTGMAMSKASGKDLKTKERHLYDLLPSHSRAALDAAGLNKYKALLVITDYISGMTDRYAHELFLKLNGTSPLIGRMT